ncbi:hypothetical protein GPECTOR_13g753 [Gonium pectorale]|uniref:Uncharacterized protein n=1 Tax=Gonium pectorale TaxID=33097 RepID=A0A150GN20_GONPE|nr:hypothetical protein GPECTOR_13g753 [Gonium pectorale]|eukprot:KXZ51266.1 hypothetical protein GPECTOR_13g753 [Gonium pectorale]
MGRESRGLSEYGQNETPLSDGTPRTSIKGGSDCGGGRDDDEATEVDVDMALRLVGRTHSFAPGRDSPSPSSVTPGTSSRTLRNSMRVPDEEEFMQRLQQNRSSWRDRSSSARVPGPQGAGGGGPQNEGLQNQTHAALEQLRGELRSLSMRSMPGGTAATSAGGGGIGAGGVHAGGSGGNAGGSSSYGGIPQSPPVAPHAAGPAWVAATSPLALYGGGMAPRYSEGHVGVSPSRLSVTHYSSGGGLPEQPSPLHEALSHRR